MSIENRSAFGKVRVRDKNIVAPFFQTRYKLSSNWSGCIVGPLRSMN